MNNDSTHKALLWILATGFFMQALDTMIVNTALPSIAHSLGVKPLAMQPIVVAYTLTMALLTPTSGWLADRFGTRRKTLALSGLVGLVTVLVFSQAQYRVMYWILPPVALLAFEADLAGVFMGMLLCIAIAIALTMHGTGPLRFSCETIGLPLASGRKHCAGGCHR
jgi:MFS family permease